MYCDYVRKPKLVVINLSLSMTVVDAGFRSNPEAQTQNTQIVYLVRLKVCANCASRLRMI